MLVTTWWLQGCVAMRAPIHRACLRMLLVALATAGTSLAALAQLPGGAQAINETYQDWQMVCAQPPQGAKRCVITQQQTDSKSNQRVLGIELSSQGDKAEGVLLLPFGLLLDKGVTLRIGETDLGSALRFRTCLPGGCMVPLSFDAKALAVLRKGATLTVNATADPERPLAFSISLKGFVPALDRAAALAK